MKQKIYCFLLICLLSPLLMQCVATQKEMRSTNVKVYSLDNRLEDIDQEVEQLKTQTVKQVQTRQAEVNNRLDSLEADLLQVKGQIEEGAHFTRLMREENKDVESSLVSNISELDQSLQKSLSQLDSNLNRIHEQLAQTENRLKLMEEAVAKINDERAAEAAERARRAAEEARKAAKAAKEAEAKAEIIDRNGTVQISPEKQKKVVVDGQDVKPDEKIETAGKGGDSYEEALALFQNKKFSQAYGLFNDYLKSFPQGDMAANAKFWQGECLYNQDEYELAILEYQKVIVEYPQHDKAPAALLKQGMSFEKLKDNETAKIIYQKILDNYPQSAQVDTARKRLQAI
jgi:tol-pal system protein YbgF